MRQRDKEILNDLERFRCLSRDDIIDLHFSHLRQPVTSCNTVLKRLRRDGHIEVNMDMQPYLYFPAPSTMKKDSAKIGHFLKIVQFYKDCMNYEVPKLFQVEPKYGAKGFVEPDVFMLWRRAPFFVEIQRSIYSKKVMDGKIKRYEDYYHSGEWKKESWQPQNKKIFPPIIMVTETKYAIDSTNIRVFQVANLKEFLNIISPPPLKVNGLKAIN